MLISGLTGGIASGAGVGASQILKSVSKNAEKILIHTTAGALVSGTTGGLGCLLSNVTQMRKINKDSLGSYLRECGASGEIIDLVWDELNSRGYIRKNQFTQKCE